MRFSFALIAIILIATCSSCKQKTTQTADESSASVSATSVKAADFNSDTAYFYVNEQVKFGPRVTNSNAHEKCAVWLGNTLKKYTPNVVFQNFTAKAYNGTILNGKNIIASFNPKSTSRVLLCSHWDSRPYADNDPDTAMHRTPIDGANDGASGVGILLEIARQLRIVPSSIGVDILLLDAEDYGAPMNAGFTGTDDWALGSQYWSHNPHVAGYTARYGVLLDMVGAENAVFTLEGTTMYYAPDIAQMVWNIGSSIGYSDYFSIEKTGAITDDHVYINQFRKIPTIDIIQHDQSTETGFYRYWHTINDNMKGISKPTLMAVGQTILTAVRSEK
jgi:hypothetical protein